MRLLLDTHIYLWWLLDSPHLKRGTRDAIAEPTNAVAVSAASTWEASIKAKLGRLETGGLDLVAEIEANGFTALTITAAHGWEAGALPPHHRDPFDRLLVAQARLEGFQLVTVDAALGDYDVTIFP